MYVLKRVIRWLWPVPARFVCVAIHITRTPPPVSYYQRDDELADIHHGLCDLYREMVTIQAPIHRRRRRCSFTKRSRLDDGARMHRMLGRICFRTGNYREAADHYTEALATATSYTALHW